MSCFVLILTHYPHHEKLAIVHLCSDEFRIVKIIEDITEMHHASEMIEMVFIDIINVMKECPHPLSHSS